jgi:hypothetical protein
MQAPVISRRLPAVALVAALVTALAACASDTKRPADAAAAPTPTADSTASATGDVARAATKPATTPAAAPATTPAAATTPDSAAAATAPAAAAAAAGGTSVPAVFAPGANSAAGVSAPPVDTTNLQLLPGRSKQDRATFSAAVRMGSRALASWPKGPSPVSGALLPGKRIVAYYGNPHSKKMGVIGEYPEQEMLSKWDQTVAQWKSADPSTPVVPAIHLVTVVAQGAAGPDGMWRRRESPEMIERTYQWAKSRNGVLFLDIQASHSTLQQELPLLLKYLERPDVHLGIDPEFYMHYKREGLRPSSKVGQMMASDVNYVIRTLDKLVADKNLPPKVLVVHRFREDMVPDAEQIRPTPRVQVVMHMDGWGPAWLKFDSFHHYIVRHPVQYTGFKLFYHNDTKTGAPLLTPKELLQLRPTLSYVQYQ